MKKLNKKEQAVFDYVCETSERQGYAPSVRDICRALDYKSTSTVQMYLDRLLEYGYLCREAGKNRSLRPADGIQDSRKGEIRIACRTENGSLTETCFDGSLPFFGERRGPAPRGLFAFRMKGESAPEGDRFGVACLEEDSSQEALCVFATSDGGFTVARRRDGVSEALLGKLMAVVHIIQ